MADPIWQRAFLAELTTSCNVAHSARSAGISSSTVYQRRDTDADFAAAWELALEDGFDMLEAEARRRAFDGTEEAVWHQGVQCGTVRKYSDGLAQFLLKGYRRQKFGDKTEITGANGGALAMVDETKKAARLAALLALARARKDAPPAEADDLSDLA